MEIIRSPDKRFSDLPNFPYEPNYLDDIGGYQNVRMHYLDEGSKKSKYTFLCLHGQPTWSFLYRKMLPIFVSAGQRVVAPDFLGFGRSDKPLEDEAYTFYLHRKTLLDFIERLDLKNIVLTCQDWGGILGLTLPMDMTERFSKLIIMNTILATGDIQLSEGFLAWREWSNNNPNMAIGRLMKRACPHLTNEECAAYDAPFPDKKFKAGVRRFPQIVPDNPDALGAEISQEAREFLNKKWSGEVFMAVGRNDPVLGPPMMEIVRKIVKNCPSPHIIKTAGHFVQEWGKEVALKALETFNIG
jgi:pimeloyl-ACP methyl ester carboxylesterase